MLKLNFHPGNGVIAFSFLSPLTEFPFSFLFFSIHKSTNSYTPLHTDFPRIYVRSPAVFRICAHWIERIIIKSTWSTTDLSLYCINHKRNSMCAYEMTMNIVSSGVCNLAKKSLKSETKLRQCFGRNLWNNTTSIFVWLYLLGECINFDHLFFVVIFIVADNYG